MLILYFLIINICGFASMGIDKKKAMHHEWRIAEKTLFLFALAGGSVGSIIGMHLFRHKTKHWYFRFGLPAIFICQLGIIILCFTQMKL